MADIFVKHVEQRSRGRSYAFMQDWPFNEIKNGELNIGFGHYDNFVNAGGAVSTNVGGWSGYKTYEDTGTKILPVTNGQGLEFVTSSTDNHECSIQAGYSVGAPHAISSGEQNTQLVFGFSFDKPSVGDSEAAVFVGLAAAGCAAADGLLTDAGGVQDKNFLGFYFPEDDGDTVDFVAKKSGQTQITKADITSLTAATITFLGFKYTGKEIVPIVNNTWLTDSKITASEVSGSTFPTGNMAMYAAVKNGAAAAYTFNMYEWFCQQLSDTTVV